MSRLRSAHHVLNRITSPVNRARLERLGLAIGDDCQVIGMPIVNLGSTTARGRISLGDRVSLVSRANFTALGVNHPVILRCFSSDAEITIADDVGISGATICANVKIEIGSGTLIGANAIIVDTDFHPIDHEARRYAPMPPAKSADAVTLGENVFVGTGAMILKGSRVGKDAVIGAGAVVVGDVPAGAIFAGNPARRIR